MADAAEVETAIETGTVPESPAPVQAVSNTAAQWFTSNVLPGVEIATDDELKDELQFVLNQHTAAAEIFGDEWSKESLAAIKAKADRAAELEARLAELEAAAPKPAEATPQAAQKRWEALDLPDDIGNYIERDPATGFFKPKPELAGAPTVREWANKATEFARRENEIRRSLARDPHAFVSELAAPLVAPLTSDVAALKKQLSDMQASLASRDKAQSDWTDFNMQHGNKLYRFDPQTGQSTPTPLGQTFEDIYQRLTASKMPSEAARTMALEMAEKFSGTSAPQPEPQKKPFSRRAIQRQVRASDATATVGQAERPYSQLIDGSSDFEAFANRLVDSR
jgi:hypothetical protein